MFVTKGLGCSFFIVPNAMATHLDQKNEKMVILFRPWLADELQCWLKQTTQERFEHLQSIYRQALLSGFQDLHLLLNTKDKYMAKIVMELLCFFECQLWVTLSEIYGLLASTIDTFSEPPNKTLLRTTLQLICFAPIQYDAHHTSTDGCLGIIEHLPMFCKLAARFLSHQQDGSSNHHRHRNPFLQKVFSRLNDENKHLFQSLVYSTLSSILNQSNLIQPFWAFARILFESGSSLSSFFPAFLSPTQSFSILILSQSSSSTIPIYGWYYHSNSTQYTLHIPYETFMYRFHQFVSPIDPVGTIHHRDPTFLYLILATIFRLQSNPLLFDFVYDFQTYRQLNSSFPEQEEHAGISDSHKPNHFVPITQWKPIRPYLELLSQLQFIQYSTNHSTKQTHIILCNKQLIANASFFFF